MQNNKSYMSAATIEGNKYTSKNRDNGRLENISGILHGEVKIWLLT